MTTRNVRVVPLAEVRDDALPPRTLRLRESEALRAAADRLYPPGDTRTAPDLTADELGWIRSRVRAVADRLEVDELDQ